MDPAHWRHLLQHGDKGEDVGAWQRVVASDGGYLGPAGVDCDFGHATHNATVAWQRLRLLNPDGVVGPATRAAIGVDGCAPTWRELRFDSLPFVQAANWSRHVPPQRKRWIVIHCMEAAESSTTAENCADWFAGKRGEAPRASAHYCVDDDSVVACVPPDAVAWHAPGANKLGIGVELAGYARQDRAAWLDSYSQRMLIRAAWLCAELSRRHSIPARFCDAGALTRGEAGFTTHAEVSAAFGKSTHWDPGPGFPMLRFLELVRA